MLKYVSEDKLMNRRSVQYYNSEQMCGKAGTAVLVSQCRMRSRFLQLTCRRDHLHPVEILTVRLGLTKPESERTAPSTWQIPESNLCRDRFGTFVFDPEILISAKEMR